MSLHVVKMPNKKYAIWDTISDTFVEIGISGTQIELYGFKLSESDKTWTWDEIISFIKDHDGDLHLMNYYKELQEKRVI